MWPSEQPKRVQLGGAAGDNEEVVYCLAEWLALPQSVLAGTRPSKEDALKAAAVVDRIRRALSHVSDNLSSVVEPISTGLGKAFGVAGWAVELFAEEVIRGGPAFALSLVRSNSLACKGCKGTSHLLVQWCQITSSHRLLWQRQGVWAALSLRPVFRKG